MSEMSRDELVALLKEWEGAYTALKTQMVAPTSVAQMKSESPLYKAIWGTWFGYTKMLARTVGDDGDWLAYYFWECRMGENPLEAHLTFDRSVPLDSIEALADVLIFDKNWSKQHRG